MDSNDLKNASSKKKRKLNTSISDNQENRTSYPNKTIIETETINKTEPNKKQKTDSTEPTKVNPTKIDPSIQEQIELLYSKINEKEYYIRELENNFRQTKTTLEKDINQEYKLIRDVCPHSYERVCVSGGCYAEYEYQCKWCRLYK